MNLLLPIVFIVLGSVTTVLGIRGSRQLSERRRRWISYPGEVYDYVWDTGSDTSVQYWMLRWIGADGVSRTAKNPHGVSGGTLREFPFPIRVLVDPDDPTNAQVADGAHSGRIGLLIMIPVGVIFVGLGVLIAVLG
ncbi:DUF3592 domain-containing protein [Microlunatus soli]|uniref:DUF3592 domain-containing protein n=1 Tax=Microlunatus soli TaxID=630515 RepID=A0A1H1UDL2_9ACTN|nr:DUF3592 domain-containing protein [Microlunatus soli]SDS70543.1 hypothetical protein SAMN04489812_2741 [Microlunatus soli]